MTAVRDWLITAFLWLVVALVAIVFLVVFMVGCPLFVLLCVAVAMVERVQNLPCIKARRP